MSDDVLSKVMASKQVTAEMVRGLRASLYNDGVAEMGEVDRLFAIDEAASEADPSWTELFIEAVTDYIVDQVHPQGHISEENANWLIERISNDGTVKSATELEMLVKVLEKAQSSPRARVLPSVRSRKRWWKGGPLAHGRELTPSKSARDGPIARGIPPGWRRKSRRHALGGSSLRHQRRYRNRRQQPGLERLFVRRSPTS
jgi:hypothetical protein